MLISKQPTRLFLKYDRYSTVIVCDTIENSRICCCICSENTKIKITLQNICNTLDAIYHALLPELALRTRTKKWTEIHKNSFSFFLNTFSNPNNHTQIQNIVSSILSTLLLSNIRKTSTLLLPLLISQMNLNDFILHQKVLVGFLIPRRNAISNTLCRKICQSVRMMDVEFVYGIGPCHHVS